MRGAVRSFSALFARCFDLSLEPKAIETAQIIAYRLNKPHFTHEGLDEHDRTGDDFSDHDRFETSVKGFFVHPDQLVFGKETAIQAIERFAKALTAVEVEHP